MHLSTEDLVHGQVSSTVLPTEIFRVEKPLALSATVGPTVALKASDF